MLKSFYLLLVSIFFTTIVERMLFEPVHNKVNIQEEESFIIKWKYQILNLHIQKYYLTNFQYVTSAMYADNKIYIWCSCGCHGEPHPGEEPHGRKLRYRANRLKIESEWNIEIILTDASRAKQLPRHWCCPKYRYEGQQSQREPQELSVASFPKSNFYTCWWIIECLFHLHQKSSTLSTYF